MQGIITSKIVTLDIPSWVGQIAQMPQEQDTLSLVRGHLQASGHSWQQRSLCLFLSPPGNHRKNKDGIERIFDNVFSNM